MIFDTVVIFALLFSCVIAFLRGFIREVLTIFGLIAGIAAAYYLGPHMVPVMTHALGEKASPDYKVFGEIHGNVLATLLAYAAVFFPVLIALSIISYFLYTGARAIGLAPLDRTLGVMFGIVRGMLLLGMLWLPVYTFTDKADRDQWGFLQGSHTRVYVEAVAGWMVGVVPEQMLAGIKKDVDHTKSDAKSAKQTLQDIDVLRKGGKDNGNGQATPPAPAPADNNGNVQPVPQPAPATPPSTGSGYQEQQRQDMGNLINKGLNQ